MTGRVPVLFHALLAADAAAVVDLCGALSIAEFAEELDRARVHHLDMARGGTLSDARDARMVERVLLTEADRRRRVV